MAAKAACYVGKGQSCRASWRGAHDLRHAEGPWSYLDSYFGGTDFLGQEVVWHRGRPVWAMNYHGAILNDAAITAAEAGEVIRAALSALYREGRFLGGFRYRHSDFTYEDTTTGSVDAFTGRETISSDAGRDTEVVYHLVYHGGLIRA